MAKLSIIEARKAQAMEHLEQKVDQVLANQAEILELLDPSRKKAGKAEQPPVEPEAPAEAEQPPVEPEATAEAEQTPVEPEAPAEAEQPPVEPEATAEAEQTPVEPKAPTDGKKAK